MTFLTFVLINENNHRATLNVCESKEMKKSCTSQWPVQVPCSRMWFKMRSPNDLVKLSVELTIRPAIECKRHDVLVSCYLALWIDWTNCGFQINPFFRFTTHVNTLRLCRANFGLSCSIIRKCKSCVTENKVFVTFVTFVVWFFVCFFCLLLLLTVCRSVWLCVCVCF